MPSRSNSSSGSNDQYKFTGYENDDEAGIEIYYAGARGYDPATGRFLQIDRFADKYPSMSTYQYSANNPTNFIDVNGDSVYQITDFAVINGWPNDNHHAYLLLAPDDLEAFLKSDYADQLQEYTFTNEKGETVTKMGIIVRAGPSLDGSKDSLGEYLGFLKAETNVGEDPENPQTGTMLVNHGDLSDSEFITNILDNHTNYMKRQKLGQVPEYSLPSLQEIKPGGTERYTGLTGYNSNSYVSGIVKASGGYIMNPLPKTPLYSNPVPSYYFSKMAGK